LLNEVDEKNVGIVTADKIPRIIKTRINSMIVNPRSSNSDMYFAILGVLRMRSRDELLAGEKRGVGSGICEQAYADCAQDAEDDENDD